MAKDWMLQWYDSPHHCEICMKIIFWSRIEDVGIRKGICHDCRERGLRLAPSTRTVEND